MILYRFCRVSHFKINCQWCFLGYSMSSDQIDKMLLSAWTLESRQRFIEFEHQLGRDSPQKLQQSYSVCQYMVLVAMHWRQPRLLQPSSVITTLGSGVDRRATSHVLVRTRVTANGLHKLVSASVGPWGQWHWLSEADLNYVNYVI
jgi:hypothetical protein